MNSKEAVKRIMEVLGLKSQYFYEAKTDQGLKMSMEGDLKIGSPIYVSTDEGMIPAPSGTHMLEDGSSIDVDEEGKVSKIKMDSTAPTGEETDDAAKDKKQKQETIKDETMAESTPDKVIEKEDGDIELADGTIVRPGNSPVMAGVKVKKVIYDGTTSAMVDGDYLMKDGRTISIVGGECKGIKSAQAKKEEAGQFTEAKTVEGTTVSSTTFAVGDDITVIKDDGSEEPAPDGVYDIELTDGDGNAVSIEITAQGGKIVSREDENANEAKQDETEEEGMEDVAAFAEAFKEAFKKFEIKLEEIANKQKEMELKFSKFSNEPAGSRITKNSTINDTNKSQHASKYEGFRKLREEILSHN